MKVNCVHYQGQCDSLVCDREKHRSAVFLKGQQDNSNGIEPKFSRWEDNKYYRNTETGSVLAEDQVAAAEYLAGYWN